MNWQELLLTVIILVLGFAAWYWHSSAQGMAEDYNYLSDAYESLFDTHKQLVDAIADASERQKTNADS